MQIQAVGGAGEASIHTKYAVAMSGGNGYLAPITPDLVAEGGQATAEDKLLADDEVALQQGAEHVGPGRSRAEIESEFVAAPWWDLSSDFTLLTECRVECPTSGNRSMTP